MAKRSITIAHYWDSTEHGKTFAPGDKATLEADSAARAVAAGMAAYTNGDDSTENGEPVKGESTDGGPVSTKK